MKEEKALRNSEWTLVGSFLLLLLSIVFLSQIHRHQVGETIATLPSHEKIPVTLSGAVAKPGTYSVLPGVTLESVLKKSRPNKFANLRNLDLKSRVEEPLELHLEELNEVQVHIMGAVEAPLTLQLPAGTRICDLKSKVSCTSDADRAIFRKRRQLVDGEVVEIGRLTTEPTSSTERKIEPEPACVPESTKIGEWAGKENDIKIQR